MTPIIKINLIDRQVTMNEILACPDRIFALKA